MRLPESLFPLAQTKLPSKYEAQKKRKPNRIHVREVYLLHVNKRHILPSPKSHQESKQRSKHCYEIYSGGVVQYNFPNPPEKFQAIQPILATSPPPQQSPTPEEAGTTKHLVGNITRIETYLHSCCTSCWTIVFHSSFA